MLKGTVTFSARIKGNGLKFPSLEFKPSEPGVDKVEIEGPNGDEILSTIHFASVATPEDGKTIATNVHTTALNRISFFYDIAIEKGQVTDSQFSPVNPSPGVLEIFAATGVLAGDHPKLVRSQSAADLKTKLEQASPPGEHNFSLLRSALQSISPVEEFMHLYHILLMLFNDLQADVDAFILGEEPSVPLTQHPLKPPGVKETIYTRLRNEFGHKRASVNLDNTKAEMANRLGGLITLTKRAIELHPLETGLILRMNYPTLPFRQRNPQVRSG